MKWVFSLCALILFGCVRGPSLPRDSFLFVTHQVRYSTCPNQSCEARVNAITGSGFVAFSNNFESWGVTAGHVCSIPVMPGYKSIDNVIKVVNFDGLVVEAEVAIIQAAVDVCILRIPKSNLPPVSLSEHAPEYGDRVYNLSAPRGLFEPGMVLKFDGYYAGKAVEPTQDIPALSPIPLDVYTVPASPGSSGSPVFNSKGEFIGMVAIAVINFETFALSPSYSVFKVVFEVIEEISSKE